MSSVVVIAPHPDDETLGCGGALLKHRAAGDAVHWIIATEAREEDGFKRAAIEARQREIGEVARSYGFDSVHQLKLPAARVDTVPMADIVAGIAEAVRTVEPAVLYVPYRGDVHTDHAAVFDAAVACTKWFRFPSVRSVLAYETLSETDFGSNPDAGAFRPNVFVDITGHLEEKLRILHLFASETGAFPFPRSAEAVTALARVRGAASGCEAAEAFMLLRERR